MAAGSCLTVSRHVSRLTAPSWLVFGFGWVLSLFLRGQFAGSFLSSSSRHMTATVSSLSGCLIYTCAAYTDGVHLSPDLALYMLEFWFAAY